MLPQGQLVHRTASQTINFFVHANDNNINVVKNSANILSVPKFTANRLKDIANLYLSK